MSNIEAVEYLKKNANKVVSEFKSDRLFLRGEGEPSPFIAGGKLVDLNVSFNGFSIGKGKLETILTKKNVLLFAAHGLHIVKVCHMCLIIPQKIMALCLGDVHL